MALKLPPLKLSQLKSLAVQCGISSSGTKAVIASRLIGEIQPSYGATGKKRVLSIDMGIRNLAYCVLEQSGIATKLPKILAWKRMAVSSKPINDPECLTPVKETFEPADFAAHAYTLLRHSLLLFSPTHILIERQRFRSMGSPRILEWTVRINMFESMLYAVLHTLSEEKIWTGTVKAVDPKKVGPYWVGTGIEKEDGQLKKTRKTKSAKAQNKGAKIDLVQNWLSNEEMVVLGTKEAKATAEQYIEKWHRRGRRNSTKQDEDLVKLDDLADSLLQGRAWLEWEQKKTNILKHGVDVNSLQ